MVRKNERSVSKFNTLDSALKLVSYTSGILVNEKIFNPKYQKMIDRISEETMMIYHNCRVANNINVNVSGEELKYNALTRLKLENEALILCESLITDIMISQKLFHLKASRVRYWTALTVDTKELIKAWYKSEKRRYGL